MTIRDLITAGVSIDAEIWLDPARDTESKAYCFKELDGELYIGDYVE